METWQIAAIVIVIIIILIIVVYFATQPAKNKKQLAISCKNGYCQVEIFSHEGEQIIIDKIKDQHNKIRIWLEGMISEEEKARYTAATGAQLPSSLSIVSMAIASHPKEMEIANPAKYASYMNMNANNEAIASIMGLKIANEAIGQPEYPIKINVYYDPHDLRNN